MSYHPGSLSLHRQRGHRAREEAALAAWLHSDIGRYMLVAAGGAVAGLAIAFASAVPVLWPVQLAAGAATGAFALWLFEFLVAGSYRVLATLSGGRRRRILLHAWRACQAAAEAEQADAGTLLRAGSLMLLLGEYAGALKTFRRVPVNAYTTRAAYNNAAIALARQARFDDARRAWGTAVKDSPGDVDVELNLAHLRVETKGYGSALRHLRLAARQGPLEPRWRHLMAWLEWVEGNRAASLNLLRELIEAADRPDPEVLCDYGVALAGHDHLLEALATLNTAVHRRPDYGPAVCNRGVVLSFLGHSRLALRDLRRARHLEPEEALVENNLGVVYHRLGRGEQAEESFHAALRKRGPSVEARYNLAQLYLYQVRWEDALHMLDAALEQRPDDLDLRVNRGCALYHLSDLLAAEQQFEAAATARYERSALVRHNLGLVYAGTGRPELALAMLRAAHNLEPEVLDHQRGLAYALHVAGHLEEALAAHKEVHQQDHSAAALYHIGLCEYGQGHIRNAALRFEQALALNPRLAQVYYPLGCAYADTEDIDQAIRYWEKGIEVEPTSGDLLTNLGLAYYRTDRVEPSLECLRRAYLLQPDSPEYCNHLALAYAKAKRYDRATDFFSKAVELEPGSAILHCNLGTAYFLDSQVEEALMQWAEVNKADPHYYLRRSDTLESTFDDVEMRETQLDWRARAIRPPTLSAGFRHHFLARAPRLAWRLVATEEMLRRGEVLKAWADDEFEVTSPSR